MNEWAQVLPLVLIVLVGWFLLIRPMRKRQRQMTSVQANLDVGTKVMLTSGIFGEIDGVDDTSVQLSIAPGTTVTVAKRAVAQVVEPPDESDIESM